MKGRSLSIALALCGVVIAGPTGRDGLHFYVDTVFDTCTKAVQTRTEASYSSLKKVFVAPKPDKPNYLEARTGERFSLLIRGPDNHACMFMAQNGAEDNRVIAQLLRQKLQDAHAERDDAPLIRGGESWLVRAAEDRNVAARVTLEMVWDDDFLVIHFLDQKATSPVPVPPVPPPPPPPPPR